MFGKDFQWNFNPGGAAMAASLADHAAGVLCDCAAVLTVSVAAENNNQLVLYDSGDNDIIGADQPKIEVRHLHADIRAFHMPQESDAAAPEIFHMPVGMLKIFQITGRRLVKFHAADEPHVGVPRV